MIQKMIFIIKDRPGVRDIRFTVSHTRINQRQFIIKRKVQNITMIVFQTLFQTFILIKGLINIIEY